MKNYAPRSCEMCSRIYPPTSSQQKVCTDCTPAFRAAKNAAYHRAKRAAAGAPAAGSTIPCSTCGQPFQYVSGPQHECPSCRKATRAAENRRWAEANPEAMAALRARAKDNYYFGGNREKALERDGFKCTECGSAEDLEVHHKDGRGTTTPKEDRNNALDNLETLCAGCHMRHHMTEKWETGGVLRERAAH